VIVNFEVKPHKKGCILCTDNKSYWETYFEVLVILKTIFNNKLESREY
jgi:hypothetical protein